jgi:hypothetical protein
MGTDKQLFEDFKKLTEERFNLDESGKADLTPLLMTSYHESKVLFTTESLWYETILYLDFIVMAQSHSSDAAVWTCKYAFVGNVTGLYQIGTPIVKKMGAYYDADVVVTCVKSDPGAFYPDVIQVSVLGDTDDEGIVWSYQIQRMLKLHWGGYM